MKTNLTARNLNVLTRQEQRDLLEEAHQENLERIKEENELASFYDLLDDEMERDDFNSYMSRNDSYDTREEEDYQFCYSEVDDAHFSHSETDFFDLGAYDPRDVRGRFEVLFPID